MVERTREPGLRCREPPVQALGVRPVLAHDSAFWRRLAYLGARYGPRFWLRYSPALFGLLFALFLPHSRRAVRQNLLWIRGPVGRWDERREVLGTFVQYAHCLAESLASGRPDARAARIQRTGEAHLREALAAGRGVLLVTAHVGPWDATARLIPEALGADVIVAMTREPDAEARALHDAIRQTAGVRIAHLGAHPLDALPLLRHLQGKGIVAVQLDRGAPSQRLIGTRLFGRPFAVPEGPFRLAALAGAPLIPVFARRRGFFAYEIVLGPSIEVSSRPCAAELARAAQCAVDAMQAFIRENPTHWFQFAGTTGVLSHVANDPKAR